MMFRRALSQDRIAIRGFTLIELLVVLVLLGLVTGIAAPALVAANNRARLDSAAAHLYDDLRRGRSVAITEGRPVTIDARKLVKDEAIELTGTAPLTFYPDGSATQAQMTLVLNANRRALTVDWLTGRVALAE